MRTVVIIALTGILAGCNGNLVAPTETPAPPPIQPVDVFWQCRADREIWCLVTPCPVLTGCEQP